MRIVHISDIHLSEENFGEFKKHYRKALLRVLQEEHEIKKIDIIAITGDLVDKGGQSLFKIPQFNTETDPFKIFQEQFIDPIKNRLDLANSNFVFIAGNHDVDESKILWVDEKNFQDLEVKGGLNSILDEIKTETKNYNERIEKFKNFEEEFHRDNADYLFSRNESTFVYRHDSGAKVGFALINDSWRCSTCLLEKHKDKGLYFGSDQLTNSLEILEKFETDMNILLTHHPLSIYAPCEQDEIKRVFRQNVFHLHLFGDQHEFKIEHFIDPNGECFGIQARAGLNNPREPIDNWQSGFHIIDIDLHNAEISCMTFYKYIYKNCAFSYDGSAKSPNGIDTKRKPLNFPKVALPIGTKMKNLDKNKYNRK
ncbi:metallophosphoesterase [Sphingobacterium thalpophilum]|uniref:metallophosphoesterase family protein n=1 Tax=Sphingobacterium thalpophilum TaxID=259 RepID=UPI0037DA0A42